MSRAKTKTTPRRSAKKPKRSDTTKANASLPEDDRRRLFDNVENRVVTIRQLANALKVIAEAPDGIESWSKDALFGIAKSIEVQLDGVVP